jgi:hypothetical protein
MAEPWVDRRYARPSALRAFYTTGIPNIEVYIPGSPAMVARAR